MIPLLERLANHPKITPLWEKTEIGRGWKKQTSLTLTLTLPEVKAFQHEQQPVKLNEGGKPKTLFGGMKDAALRWWYSAPLKAANHIIYTRKEQLPELDLRYLRQLHLWEKLLKPIAAEYKRQGVRIEGSLLTSSKVSTLKLYISKELKPEEQRSMQRFITDAKAKTKG